MDKFGRNYRLTVEEADGGTLTITPPLTVEFDITRNTLSSMNCGQLRIFNLAEKNRGRILFNRYQFGDFRTVTFKAGYGDNLATCFRGNISQAWSVRERVNFITQIECFDGGFASVNGKTNMVFTAGTPIKTVITQLAQSLPEIKLGKIGDYPGVLPKDIPVGGSTCSILAELTGGGFFIDNGKAFALGTTEFTDDKTFVVNAKSGLLGTPTLEQTQGHFDMLFEPGINVGQKVQVESLTNKKMNGLFTVRGVKHRGVISEAVCGTAVTTISYLALSNTLSK